MISIMKNIRPQVRVVGRRRSPDSGVGCLGSRLTQSSAPDDPSTLERSALLINDLVAEHSFSLVHNTLHTPDPRQSLPLDRI